jgi:hypothetical protein
MLDIYTDEWCQATGQYACDNENALFSLSEPRWALEEESRKIKDLKLRLHDIYAEDKMLPKSS